MRLKVYKPRPGRHVYTPPKGIANHPGVAECISGHNGGSDYRHDVFLKPGWKFTEGRNAGCRGLLCHSVADFLRAAPMKEEG